MVEPIDKLQLRLAQLLEDDIPQSSRPSSVQITPQIGSSPFVSSNPFEDVLAKAVNALDNISKTEMRANQLIGDYIHGKADLQDVMIATSKSSVLIQLAITTINSAVSTFKEITQMQV
ncbi:flagellar hook-basal body complex protein FliE [Candidatus Saganbacteria bacterium]|nr:flagellar hook-basal body complex protein FliE [Candidatus Saganbacteria bacterium]